MSTAPTDDTSALDALANALNMIETAHRHLRNRVAHDVGINITDLTVIGIISDLGRLTPKLLATEISMTTGAVTAVIDRLVAAGYVARIPNPRDRRSVYLELTGHGMVTATLIQDSYRAAAAAALHASPDLGTEETAEELARAAVAITASTMDSSATHSAIRAA